MTEPRRGIEAALDVVLYAPVGVMLTISEELPRWAAKGWTRLESQLRTARVVGEFAVTQGKGEIERRLDRFAAGPDGAGTVSEQPERPLASAGARSTPAVPARPERRRPSRKPDTPGAAASRAARHRSARPTPAAETLAIPGYDSLSASQVVQRLAGLSPAELESVRAYEAASRNRRTILTRVSQLQG